MGPAVLWGEGVAASAAVLTGMSSVGSAVGTAVTAGVIGGTSAFAGGVACAAGSGSDYHDCANLAAAGSALHGTSYLAGTGINVLNQVRNTIPRNRKALVGPGHTNPDGFTYSSDLSPDDPQIVQRQRSLSEKFSHAPLEDQSFLRRCDKCSSAMAQEGDIIWTIGSDRRHNITVDGKDVGFPHQVIISPDGLVWDAPSNTWGQDFYNYLNRLDFTILPEDVIRNIFG